MKILWQRQYDEDRSKYKFQVIDTDPSYYVGSQFKPNTRLQFVHLLFRLQ